MSETQEPLRRALAEQKALLEQHKEQLLPQFQGRFVAFRNGDVLADGATYEEVAGQVFGADGLQVPEQPVLISRVQPQETPLRIAQDE